MEGVVKEKGRLVEFSEAYNYMSSGKSHYYLNYFKAICNLFDLEFFTNKLASPANTMVNVEKMVLSGVPFWEDGDEAILEEEENEDKQEEESPKP